MAIILIVCPPNPKPRPWSEHRLGLRCIQWVLEITARQTNATASSHGPTLPDGLRYMALTQDHFKQSLIAVSHVALIFYNNKYHMGTSLKPCGMLSVIPCLLLPVANTLLLLLLTVWPHKHVCRPTASSWLHLQRSSGCAGLRQLHACDSAT
jgi:hypothetical protein